MAIPTYVGWLIGDPTYVRPSVHKKFLQLNEIWNVGRGR